MIPGRVSGAAGGEGEGRAVPEFSRKVVPRGGGARVFRLRGWCGAGRCQCLIGCRWLGGAAGKNPCGQVPVFYSMHISTVPQFDGIKQNEVRRDSPDDQLVPIPVARRPMDVSSSQYSCDWQTSEPDFPSATPPTTRSASCGSAIVRPER